MDLTAIGRQIAAEAARIGGATWPKIQAAAPLYIRGYLHTLADIAAGVGRGEITRAAARMYVRNAHLLLIMGIANTSQIVMVQVQSLMDSVVRTLRGAINAALPVAIL
ncbi:MAG: hypothetical protein NTV73_18610 [Hyphomicrobiales bacterium]|nr:hypothetical protein [Hyphomicrobiales bacterium]